MEGALGVTGGPLINTAGPRSDRMVSGGHKRKVFTGMLLEMNFSLKPCHAQSTDDRRSNATNFQVSLGHLCLR